MKCRLCNRDIGSWVSEGHHDCKRGKDKPLGLLVHRLRWGIERHYRCEHCGTQWRESA